MKKLLPVFVISVFFLLQGCSGYYSQDPDSPLYEENNIFSDEYYEEDDNDIILPDGTHIEEYENPEDHGYFMTPDGDYQKIDDDLYSSYNSEGELDDKWDDHYEDEIDEIPDIPLEETTEDSTSSSEETKSVTVYITNTGERYHSSDCYHLRQSKNSVSLSYAKAHWYTPCSHCHPPQ